MAIESALREPDDTLFATRFADQMDAESWKAIADVLGRQKITDSETRVFVEMLDEVSVHRMKIPSDDKVAQMLLARVRQVAGRRREELLNRLETILKRGPPISPAAQPTLVAPHMNAVSWVILKITPLLMYPDMHSSVVGELDAGACVAIVRREGEFTLVWTGTCQRE